MKKFTKVVALVAVMLLSVAALAGCGGTKDAGGVPEKVVVGTQGLMNLETYAELKGYIEAEMGDVAVEYKQFNAGKDINQAFAAGEIDFAVLGASPVAVALSNEIDYQVIYSTAILTNTEALVAKDGSGIKSLKDLEGKKVATTFTSTAHYSLLSGLEAQGVDASKVEILDMEPDKIVAAWTRGDIDAAYTWNPALGTMKADGGHIVITSGKIGDLGYPVADFAVVRTEFAEQYPDLVTAYLKAVVKAEDDFANDPSLIYDAFAEHFEGYTAADVKAAMTDDYVRGADQVGSYFDNDEFSNLVVKISKFLASQEQIPAELEADFVKAHVDGSYLKSATE